MNIMKPEVEFVESTSSGRILCKDTHSTRVAYDHQIKAMQCLDKINENHSFATMVVLPTGGGKTSTASVWLLKNAIDKKKKVLWIAHRQMLLDQAFDSFAKQAYRENLPYISSFKFRIISGADRHGRTIDIKPDDQLIIASKDSIGRNLSCLDEWLKCEDELYFVIDEAHHSIAKTYRKIIEYVKQLVPNLKLIGLTATPFRTSAKEEGLLAKIYSDGFDKKKNVAVYGDLGITYEINLKELIKRQILSAPIFEQYFTEERYGDNLSVDEWNTIQHFDSIPDKIAEEMVQSKDRNNLIVKTYKEKQQQYGQTLVFAVNINHAIQLKAVFEKEGIRADYIVSSILDGHLLINLSKENEEKIEKYRNKEINVLINVNILTEGVDLPQTQTVFLARPTVSTILMTQMVGRALRGVKAGGTAQAYIVSFIDNWNDHIAWVNPESLFEGSNDFLDTDPKKRQKRDMMLISVSKIEEFAKLLSGMGGPLENVPFMERIPLGMYTFSYNAENAMDYSCEVMVYNSTEESYKKFINYLPELFKKYSCDDEILPDEILFKMEAECHDRFFRYETIPPYSEEDILNILKYYAQNTTSPQFYSFNYIDKNKLDLTKIAQHIIDEDMGERKQKDFVDSLWKDNEDNLLRLFFTNKLFFISQLNLEKNKILYPELYPVVDSGRVIPEPIPLDSLTIQQIKKIAPKYAKFLCDTTFEKSKNIEGKYQCAICGLNNNTRDGFEIDHILPMNKGGKSVLENLQILCRNCNRKKSDK